MAKQYVAPSRNRRQPQGRTSTGITLIVLLSAFSCHGLVGAQTSPNTAASAPTAQEGSATASPTNATNGSRLMPTAPPDDVIYRALFFQVAHREQFADHIEKGGHDATSMRKQTGKSIGLTDAENDVLRSVAKSWMAQNLTLRNQMLSVSKQTDLTPDQRAAQMQALSGQEKALMASSIDQLRTGLGLNFATLDSWVRSTIAPKIKWYAVKPKQGQ